MCKVGNPKNASDFFCLKCMNKNQLGGIQRRGHKREKWHVKDLYCIDCGVITKNIEIRSGEFVQDVYDRAVRIRSRYYSDRE